MVYYGTINDTQVAVKMLSQASGQGYQQFQAEVRGSLKFIPKLSASSL